MSCRLKGMNELRQPALMASTNCCMDFSAVSLVGGLAATIRQCNGEDDGPVIAKCLRFSFGLEKRVQLRG